MRSAEQLKEDELPFLRETITAGEAAQLLGVSEWSVYDLARRHIIPHVKLSRRVLFRRTSLLSWLEAQEQASVALAPELVGQIRRLK
ncbi:Helix-turn-helix domain protein [Pelotomaculum sp. FP]|uniref:helix-turn-helix domain-containing protein n=1 Tax=Pelotomaculum sp. FP TaxID=261474 RepID=UPI001100455C|nr:helix-turn-helix domain-containing protein [Pelotomaculum sp. FP]TEB14615.1 Helix-turn-helix domain protein [Pelotomaculum sp. FP]